MITPSTSAPTRAIAAGLIAIGMIAVGSAPRTAAGSVAGPPSLCTTVPAGLSLIAASPTTGVVAISATAETALTAELPAPPARAARAPDGTTWVEVHQPAAGPDAPDAGQVLTVAPDGTSTVVLDGPGIRLYDVGWVGGRSAALIVDHAWDDSDDFEWGNEYVAYGNGELVRLGSAGGGDTFISAVGLGNDTIAQSWVHAAIEGFAFYDANGIEREGFFNPTHGATHDDLPFWLAPSLSDPVTSTDPLLLSWVEAPDYPPDTALDDPQLAGGWTVVLADALAGTVLHRVPLTLPLTAWLDQSSFDGRFWVGSFGERDAPTRTVAIDFAAASPTMIDVGCAPDVVATIDRQGAPQPVPILPAAAAAPAGGCDGVYADAGGGDLPIRPCTKGTPVEVVQRLLVVAGHDIDADGHFGPGTTAAVLQFQRDHGLDADGLVGPRTWAQLLAVAGIDAGNMAFDSNGNGRLDPGDRGLLITTDDHDEPAQPISCNGQYSDNGNTMPVRPCQSGDAVYGVQAALSISGYDIDMDGHFGPGTQTAVLHFQQSAGLAVDGLVGPRTWDALIPGGSRALADLDGDGTAQPWEFAIFAFD